MIITFNKGKYKVKDFNYHQLISFVEVAQSLNISSAAQHLNKSRATISEHIETLEFDVGHKLFDRSGRKLKLTRYGKEILCPSILLIRQIYTWQNTLEKACPDSKNIRLRVAYDIVMPKEVIRDMMAYFHAINIDIECVSISTNISNNLLDKHATDLIIIPNVSEDQMTHRDAEWRAIGSMPYRFYAHKDLFNSEPVELSQLFNETQILPSEYYNKCDDDKFIFTPNNKIINDMELFKESLINGMGWAFIPKHLQAENWENIKEINCSLGREGFITPIMALWRPGEEVIISPILKYFESLGPIHVI